MATRKTAGEAKFLEQQRKRLLAMRDELQKRDAGEAEQDRTTRPEGVLEAEDEAQRLAQRDADGAVDVVEQRRLRMIERALAKIEEGTYGLSELSGDPIPKARLEASPEALFTIQEEAAREKHQRR